jgi:hypothetical protein
VRGSHCSLPHAQHIQYVHTTERGGAGAGQHRNNRISKEKMKLKRWENKEE